MSAPAKTGGRSWPVPARGRRAVLILAVGLLAVTAGCAGGGGAQLAGGGGDGGEQAAQSGEFGGDAGQAARTEAPETEGSGGDSDGGPAQVRDRAIIRTGTVALEVEDFDAAQRNLTATVRAYGGFVSDSRVEVERVDNATYKRGELVLRVPRENFSVVMERAQAVGDVESVSRNSKDVTDRLVDLEARLKNLRAERDRLRQLYRNASDTEDVLAVEERLSEVQGEIERLEARQKSLERQVALSTIRVDLREPRPDPGPIDADRWFDTPVLVAFLQSVEGVITSLRALVVAAAYGLPYAFVYGPLVVVVAYGVRRWRRGSDRVPLDAVPGISTDAADERDGTTENGTDGGDAGGEEGASNRPEDGESNGGDARTDGPAGSQSKDTADDEPDGADGTGG